VISNEELIIFARKMPGLALKEDIKVINLSGRGSDRSFYRLTWGETGSAILVHYEPTRVENAYYRDIAIFLDGVNIPVPKILCHDSERRIMIMEDLGSADLWTLRNEPQEHRKNLYQKTLTIVHRLHSFQVEEFPSTKVRLMEPFGPELYRWERAYFRNNFVKRVCGIEPDSAFAQELEVELSSLADRVHTSGPSLVHRDLQSQNIMIRNEEPYLIDFQGMRIGSQFYDLGSLLCDPYVSFSDTERNELLAFYYGLSKQNLSFPDFQRVFWEASAQRLMQALGAYGFLGMEKGLSVFLDHIPAGLANLQRAASHVPILPRLRELLDKCQKLIGSS
jgi:N-acetylmuramate 1-kinase